MLQYIQGSSGQSGHRYSGRVDIHYASIYSMGAVDNLVIGTVVEWIYASIYSMGAVDNLVTGTVVE